MATLGDIGMSALINILSALAFLFAFALLRIQPINDRVYFTKWYIEGRRSSPTSRGGLVGRFVNLNFRTYLTFLNWMPQALKMSESEIINHAGLDSAVFLRIYRLGYFQESYFLSGKMKFSYCWMVLSVCYCLSKSYDIFGFYLSLCMSVGNVGSCMSFIQLWTNFSIVIVEFIDLGPGIWMQISTICVLNVYK